MTIESYKIESKAEADEFLAKLFEVERYRSISEVQIRAQKYIHDKGIKDYFVSKAEELLRA